MENKLTLTRRGRIVLIYVPALVLGLFIGYSTRDICYVGLEHGNAIGYGSCSIIDGGR